MNNQSCYVLQEWDTVEIPHSPTAMWVFKSQDDAVHKVAELKGKDVSELFFDHGSNEEYATTELEDNWDTYYTINKMEILG